MRLLPILLIAFAVIVSIAAIGSLAANFGVGVDRWYGPLGLMHIVYADLQQNAFGAFARMVDNRLNIQLPVQLGHIAALYLCAALAFVSGSTGVAHRERVSESVKATALGAVMPLAIPLFIWQAIRIGAVSRFARENTMSFFGYIALVLAGYGAAVWANGALYAPEPDEEETVLAVDATSMTGSGADSAEQIARVLDILVSGGVLEAPEGQTAPETAPETAQETGPAQSPQDGDEPPAQEPAPEEEEPQAQSGAAQTRHAGAGVAITRDDAYEQGAALGQALRQAAARDPVGQARNGDGDKLENDFAPESDSGS